MVGLTDSTSRGILDNLRPSISRSYINRLTSINESQNDGRAKNKLRCTLFFILQYTLYRTLARHNRKHFAVHRSTAGSIIC
jgi:hypothetical protein